MTTSPEGGPRPIAPDAPHPSWANGAPADHVNGLVPFARVADMRRSLDFYAALGFEVASTFEPEGDVVWAWLESGRAHLMLARSSERVDPAAQAVLF